MKERTILHSDCNSFFASVEEVIRPELKKVPMAVCGSVENRHGIVLAKNQLAKKYNIVTAETVNEAKRKCPDLIMVEPHYDKYVEYSENINDIYHSYTDRVEPFGIDESWLDISGCELLFGNGREIAEKLRKNIRENLGITVSIGVSYNKVFAKMGSDYKKPDAITEITRENYKDILYPLPITNLFMVGVKTAEELRCMGVSTIGNLSSLSRRFLSQKFGKFGEKLYEYANGFDTSPVLDINIEHTPQSVGNGMTFCRDLVTRDDISAGAVVLCDEVASRLRKYNLKGNTLRVTVKTSDFKTISKQKILPCSLNTRKDIHQQTMSVIDLILKPGTPVRSITVTCTNLSWCYSGNRQLCFGGFDQNDDQIIRHGRIDKATDIIRAKYRRDILQPASSIGNSIGV